ncbi:hypothetical protein SAY86_020985 [Trapa natans]|uniref:Protein kinase domain-containing protein n=1 Tax=Trapa natans TaxID=22666 RepID=A0AAN7MYC9_TRANT|nr:hypothetical protein SAY86_020985 [Trapa natans]
MHESLLRPQGQKDKDVTATLSTSFVFIASIILSAFLFNWALSTSFHSQRDCEMGRVLEYLRSKLGAFCCRSLPADDGHESCSGPVCSSQQPAIKRYGWSDIEALTENFATVIGYGGFSTVYLGRSSVGLDPAVAMKVQYHGSDRLNLAFKQELDILLRLRHQNIVSLIGYCEDPDSGALVFEYVAGGDLHEKLHGEHAQEVLPWKARVKIAFQLAQALEYLHDKCDLHVVHGDLKPSNILLVGEGAALKCKLCDFGSAKLGFSSTVLPPTMTKNHLRMTGSPGYVDPQYLRTGVASKKNDIYSFGVVLLEMVMGVEAFCAESGQILAVVAAPALRDLDWRTAEGVKEMVDPRLEGEFEADEARAMLHVARLCLDPSPVLRPSAGGVIQIMNEQIPSICRLWSEKAAVSIHHR